MIETNKYLSISHDINNLIEEFAQYQKIRENFENDDFDFLALFQVDLDNMDSIQFAFSWHMRLNPNVIDQWPYYKYEAWIDKLHDVLKKKQEAEKGSTQQQSNYDPQREAGKFMKNVPKVQTPNIKMPSIKKF